MTESAPTGAEMLQTLEAALQGSPADQTEIVLLRDRTAVTRYANSEIHQNVLQDDRRAAVRVAVNGATARIFTNAADVDGLRRAVEEATALARRSARNPRFTSLPGPDSALPVDTPAPPTFFPATAGFSPTARAEAVGRIIDAAAAEGYSAFGTYRITSTELAVANSLGVRAYAPATTAYLKALVDSGHGTGYADALDRDVAQISPEAIAREAVAKCRANHDPIELPPGEYAALFDPNAVADMVRFPVLYGLGGRSFLDGQSFMTGKIGERVIGADLSIWDDPRDPRCLPLPIDYEGLPAGKVMLIEDGIARGVVWDSETATQEGGPGRATGHAADPWWYEGGPTPGHVVLPEGTATAEELARQMKRGVWVTRFHYTHCPDPKRVIATGTTRDGTFLVENGEVVAAVRNLRFAMSVLDLLGSTEALGRGKCCQDWWAANGMGSTVYYLPAILFGRCQFTGVTTF
jgi:predicted Zn-dependent protease